MEDKNKWSYKVTSNSRTHGMNSEQINEVLNCYKHEEYQEFKEEMRKKNKIYDSNPTAKWQLEKSDEIEKTWHENLKHEIKGDKVYVEVEFEVTLPESFDKGDVIEWCEGFHRLRQIHPMVLQKEIIKLYKDNNVIPEDYYKTCKVFLEELRKNQTLQVKQIS